MSLDRDVQLLKKVALFDVLDVEQLKLLAFNAELRRFRAGEILFEEGDPAAAAFVIIDGEVSLTRSEASPSADIRYFGPGTILGEMAMIANSNRPATARAETHGEMFVIPRRLFHRILDEFPDTAARLQKKIAARLRLVVGDLATVRPLFDDAV
ncbi:MAG: cyclic nucleotide-binding domain-containing protein [Fimbriimonadaceae bacterium]|nr:cyclic nucleotide-binding domain-containing protein [Alphaproteobacteria bacterium]